MVQIGYDIDVVLSTPRQLVRFIRVKYSSASSLLSFAAILVSLD